MICIKNFNDNKNKDNRKMGHLKLHSKVDNEYRNDDELINENSYMKYELNNTFTDKGNKEIRKK